MPVGRVVVVGAGLAGVETAKALRALGFDGELLLLGDESDPPYDRPPLSKHVLRGEREPFFLLPTGHDLDVRLGVRAVGLDLPGRQVLTTSGNTPYDALVVATGAEPRRLPGAPGLALRTLADSQALRERLVPGSRLAVVGAGLIGCEVAASARSMGCEVQLVDVLHAPLIRVLGAAVGGRLAALHRSHGVALHLGVAVERAAADGLLLVDGTALPCDVLLEALGVQPTVEWLRDSGLRLDDGVRCDGVGRTSAPGVWAVGDVASWDGVRTEHWTSAVEQAAVVARSVLGDHEPLEAVPYWWSEQFDLRLQGLGRVAGDDDVEVVRTGTKQREVAVYSRHGRLTGVVGFSASATVMRLRPAVAARSAVDEVLAGLL